MASSRLTKALRADERGASFIEYLLLAGLIGLIAWAGVRLLGKSIHDRVDKAADRVATLEGADSSAMRGPSGRPSDAKSKAAPASADVPEAKPGLFDAATALLEGRYCLDADCLALGSSQTPPSEKTGWICDALGCHSPGNCFGQGTQVATPTGLRAIESMHPGDLVLARDVERGTTAARAVLAVKVTPARPVLTVGVGGDELVVTREHPFYVEARGWISAGELSAGDRVVTEDGAASVFGIIAKPGLETVYNLEVEDLHTYYVGASEALVHNDCTPEEKAKKSDRLDALETENGQLQERRKDAKTPGAEDRIDNQVDANKKEIAKLEREIYGDRAGWASSKGTPSEEPASLLATVVGMDPDARREAMAGMSAADVRAIMDSGRTLDEKARSELWALGDRVKAVRSGEIDDLKAQYDAAMASGKANEEASRRSPWIWEKDTRQDSWTAARADWSRAGDLAKQIQQKQLALMPAEDAERYAELTRLRRQLASLAEDRELMHLPPTFSGGPRTEVVNALSPEDAAHAWAIWARQQKEIKEVAAFDAALANNKDKAAVQAEIDAAIKDARGKIHANLTPGKQAEFDRMFVAKAKTGEDGKVVIVFLPTPDTRRLQAQQAAAVNYERIEFGRRRTGAYNAPSDSAGALGWWVALGSTDPRKLAKIVEPNHAIRATGDEMILVPGATLMQVGRVGVGKLVVQGTGEILINAAVAVTVEKVGEKFGPTAGTATPVAILLTAVLTRRYVLGPRAAAAAPTLAAEAKAALAADCKVAARAEAKVATAETRAAVAAETKAATTALPTYSKADAAKLLDASEGRAFGNNTGHARAHVPREGQDPLTLAMSRPTKENNTVLRVPRHGEQALRDAMNAEKEALAKLKVGDAPVQGTIKLGETVPAYNSTLGKPPTIVHIKEFTYSIVRHPDGSLHLLHFAPRVPK